MIYEVTFASLVQRVLRTKFPTRPRVIRAFFGLSVPMLSRVYTIISQPGEGEPISPFDLLVGLHFLKKYETEDVTCVLFDISGKTWKEKRDAALVALYLRLPEVVLHSLTIVSLGVSPRTRPWGLHCCCR